MGWDGKAVLIAKETGERTAPIKKPKTLYGASRLQAEKELNAAYVLYEKDPEYKETFYLKLYAYVRSTRSNASYVKLVNRAEMYIDAGDILGAFLLKITSLIENGKYTHEGKMENWLGFHWGNYHFPEVQTEIKSYLDRSIYVNQTAVGRGGDDNEDKNFEHQNHSVAIKNVQEEQVEREQHKGYFFPVSRDRLFREMNPITQDIVRMLCEGLSITEIAARVNISPRHIRRVATEEGEDALNNVLSTLQACADEDNVLPWPCGVGEIQASAEDVFEPLLGVPEAAKLLRIHPKTLQALARSGSVPCIRMGKYWRFRESSLDAWVEEQLISNHQSRRAS